MRILFIADALWPDHTSGISKSISNEISGIANLGNSIVVVTRSLRHDAPFFERLPNCTLYRYASPPIGSRLYRSYPVFSLGLLPRLLSRLNMVTPFDVVYVHNPFQAVGLQMSNVRSPYVFAYHASACSEVRLDAERGKYGSATMAVGVALSTMRKLESRALSRANAIIVHSRFMRKDLLSNYGPDLDSKVNVLPLCVDVDRYHPALDMAVTRRILGIPIDRPTILTVRRLVARTGIENLLSAVALVRQQIPNVLLLVAGSGYLRQQLSDYISGRGLDGNVILLGHVPELDLPLYYQSADVFILPTVAYEGFGLSTIEALASGTPVLATRVGATPELLEPLGADFLLPGQGAEHMAAGILRWLGRKGEVSVREKCRAYCVDHFAVDTVCSALNGLLHEIAAT